MPIGTYFNRLGSYIKGGVRGFAGGFGAFTTLESLKKHLDETPIDPVKKQTYLSRLDEIYKQFLDGNFIGGYRDTKRLVYHLYADIFRFPDELQERLDDVIARDELFTDLMFAADVAEFLPVYKGFVDRLSKFRIIKWLNGLVGTDLEPVDLGLMTWAGLRSGYLKYYLWNVFEEKGYNFVALREAARGAFKVVLHAGIEKALPGEAAPLFFDNVALDLEVKRFQLERPELEHERVYEFRPRTREEFFRERVSYLRGRTEQARRSALLRAVPQAA